MGTIDLELAKRFAQYEARQASVTFKQVSDEKLIAARLLVWGVIGLVVVLAMGSVG